MSKVGGTSYIVQSLIGMGGYSVLAAIVTVKILSASQLGVAVQVGICGFLWGFIVWGSYVLWRYYKALPDESD